MAAAAAGAAEGQGDAVTVRPAPVHVFVELSDEPAAVAFAKEQERARGTRRRPTSEAVAAARAQLRRIEPEQEDLATALAFRFGARELFRLRRVLNGVAVTVDGRRLGQIRALPGVKAVRLIEPEYKTSSTSVPFLGLPAVWEQVTGAGLPLTGQGVTIGVIDSGIDYQHAAFGGTGLLADYLANDRTTAPDAFFPTAKVAGGWDFAGDDYTGSSSVPAPDPDPTDCDGHGTHVAAIAAGFGVDAGGGTFGGPFGAGAPFPSLRIGPGAAPEALLYALRVFGCTGGTTLTAQAIDWAVDPDDDGDFSDRLDVVNLSLGTAFGGLSETSVLAAENAARAGVVVVAAAGNDGDTWFVGGSPGSAPRAISVAASGDSGAIGAVLAVNAPPAIAGFREAAPVAMRLTAPLAADVTADVVRANPANGCAPLLNAAAVAGNVAFVDRGVCTFGEKVAFAEAAGAVGVVIANNVPTAVPLPGDPDVAAAIPAVFVSQADGNAIRAQLLLAATVNVTLPISSDLLAAFSSRGPRGGSPGRTALKPDLAAPGLTITSAQTGITCLPIPGGCQRADPSGFLPGSQPLVLSGTSMATPHVAGVMALLRELHPDWTVEELKALAMNTAFADVTTEPGGAGLRHGPGRVGAGRVRPDFAAAREVVAFDAEDPGVVSVSFETEVVGTVTLVRKVRLVNKGTADATYLLAIDTVVDAPGVSFSLPGGTSVTVPAGETVEVDVQMSADAAAMEHAREATVSDVQTSPSPPNLMSLSRRWLTEEAGYLTFAEGGLLRLRVPLYAAARPASRMAASPAVIATGGAPTGSTSLPLAGTDVCTGTRSAGPTCTGSFPADRVSLVSPFELQVVSPRDPGLPAHLDLQYAGVAYTGTFPSDFVLFGLSTWGPWSTPTDVVFNIYVDNNEDGVWDRIVFNGNPGTTNRLLFGGTASAQDTFNAAVFVPMTSSVFSSPVSYVNRLPPSAGNPDSALFNTNVMFLAVRTVFLGLSAANPDFRYRVVTCPGTRPLCEHFFGMHEDEAAGPYSWNRSAQGLGFGGTTLEPDLAGGTLPVTWNAANLAANGSLGGLLLHHLNAEGERAQVVLLEGAPAADLSLGASASPAGPRLGDAVTLTATLANQGTSPAAGVVVDAPLPPGLTWVSDDSGGAYDPATGRWTVGSLAVGAAASLQVVATLDATDTVCPLFQVTAGTPLDPDPSDNQASTCLAAPRSADLELTMSTSVPTALVGASVDYILVVVNRGPDPAYDLTVTEGFPLFPLLDPSASLASQGVYDPGTGQWKVASLAPGASASLRLTVTVPLLIGLLTNLGTATAVTADGDVVNNAASAAVSVLSPGALAATKTASGTFRPGTTVTYAVVLTNPGLTPQLDNPGDELTDVLPAALALVDANATSGTVVADPGTNTVTWNGAVSAGGSVTITITATIDGAATGGQLVANQGTVSFDADGNGTNETSGLTDDPGTGGASDPTWFRVVAPVTIDAAPKTVSGTFAPGTLVTYTIDLWNTSDFTQGDNPGDELVDVLPPELVLVSASASRGSAVADVPSNTVTWNGTVPGGSSTTVTIQARIAGGVAVGQVVANQGTFSYDADGDGTNDTTGPTDDLAQPGGADPTLFTVRRAPAVDRNQPGATLLLPYFEVDPDDDAATTTLLSVNNASAAAVLARVTLWTDLGVPTLGFNLYLTGYDLHTINLRDVFNGALPQTASVGQDPGDTFSPRGPLSADADFASCAGLLPGAPPAPEVIDHLRLAHSGLASPLLGGQCAGLAHGDGLLRGYVTVDTVNACGVRGPADPGYFGPGGTGDASNENVLWGDYFHVDPDDNFARGDNLVAIAADATDPGTSLPGQYTFYGRLVGWSAADNRHPLGGRFAARYLSGGAFSGGTRLLVWRDPKTAPAPFACPAGPGQPAWFGLGQEEILVFDEQEQVVAAAGTPFPGAANAVTVNAGDLPVPYAFGWFYLNLHQANPAAGANPPEDPAAAQAFVANEMSAEGLFSVGLRAIVLESAGQATHVCLDGGGSPPCP